MAPQQDGRIIGIDFGTTNSVVALYEGQEPVVVPSLEGENKTPSVIAFLDNGEVIVGEKARRQAVTNPRRTISSVKRLLGRSFEDVEESGDTFPFEIVNQDGNLMIDIDGMGYRPEQIAALVIQHLREAAEHYTGEKISKAVITVPAYYDDLQRQSTIEAATMAGLEVLRLINEPTAAAVAYGFGRSSEKDETIVVYDFGGGTFDVTILDVSGKTFEVLASTGDSHLGGDDLDNALVNMVIEEFYEEHAIDLSKDIVTIRRLKDIAEKTKIELSQSQSARLSLPFIAQKDGAHVHLDRLVTREEFEELIESFVNRTIRCCKRALDDAGIKKGDVSKVVLVGGSSRIPLVQDAIEDFFGVAAFKGVNPDEVVAVGAATQAGVFEGNLQEVMLLDVTPHSLGIEVKDGKFSRIIEKNSTIPIKAAKVFTTTEPNQSFVNIHVLQGESMEAAENRSLGKFTLAGLPPAPAGVPRVRVTFFINADGVIEISATELGSGAEKSLTVMHSELDQNERGDRKKRRDRAKRAVTGAGRAALRKKRPAPGETASATGTVGTGVPLRRPGAGDTPAPKTTFAVVGDSAGSAIPPEVAEANRRLQRPATPPGQSPAPVDYAKAPQTYTSATPTELPQPATTRRNSGDLNPQPLIRQEEARGDKTRLITPLPLATGQPPAAANPVPAKPPAPPPFVPPKDAPAPAPPDRIPVHDMPAPAPVQPPPPADDEKPAPAMPAAYLAVAERLDRQEDNPQVQHGYLAALKALESEPYRSSQHFAVVEARTKLQVAAGQATEARASLKAIREQHLARHAEEAKKLHDLALERFAMGAPHRRDRSALREALGDYLGAAEDLEQAARQEPAESDQAALERIYTARLKQVPEDPGTMFKLVKILVRKNRVDEAIALLNELQRFDAYQTRAVKILGLCHWQQNLHILAWQKFKQLPVTEDMKDILYRLGGDMERTDQLAAAASVYEHLVENDPDYRDASARLKKLQYRVKLQQDGSPSDSQKLLGVLNDPRFVVLEEINRGSMGIIYKAKDKTLEEIVALKILNDYLMSDPMAIERFKREARAAKRLGHPYIIRIHDMFESGSKRFISMEYIEGTDLKRLLSERTTFTEEMILYYMMQICDAIAYAHKLGVIHRDIKPANIMITKQNIVKIADFGIAKLLKGDDSTKSGTAVIGTPLYMAPEQITGSGVDMRSDIYSLGIVMYELVAGTPPFYLGNIEYHHIHTAPPPLPDRVSPEVRSIILKCIAKDPNDRYQTVDEILEALKQARKA